MTQLNGIKLTPAPYSDLIDAAYAAVDEPGQLDDLLEIAERYVHAHRSHPERQADGRTGDFDTRLIPHLERIERLLTKANADPFPGADTFHAQFSLDADRMCATGNAAAEAMIGRQLPCSIEDLPFDRASLKTLQRSIREAGAHVPPLRDKVMLVTIETPTVRSCLALVQGPISERATVRIGLSYINWSPDLLAHLREAFGLTESELDVLEGHLNNLSVREIAGLRGRSPETIKAQTKAILRKGGCGRISDVVQLCASIAYLLRSYDGQPAAEENPGWQAPRENMGTLCRQGRSVAYYAYGSGERQVVFLHGLIHGPFLSDSFIRCATANRLTIICPSRPGFGFTSPARKAGHTETALEDTLALIEGLGAGPV
ncbi:MAG: hypothetical protein VKJ09_15565, partial [Leptolyngbya sp.]|nr:hypothetical protein [Leptolyngbya sp.]